MSPLGVARYILTAAVFVISLFFAMRLIFAHDMRREVWRSVVKRYVYFSQSKFKVWSITLGWIFLFIALWVAYLEIDQLITNS
jgi:hypothetical protein